MCTHWRGKKERETLFSRDSHKNKGVRKKKRGEKKNAYFPSTGRIE